jgi:hypothetical protein
VNASEQYLDALEKLRSAKSQAERQQLLTQLSTLSQILPQGEVRVARTTGGRALPIRRANGMLVVGAGGETEASANNAQLTRYREMLNWPEIQNSPIAMARIAKLCCELRRH